MNVWASGAAGAGAVALLELDSASIGPFFLSRPIVVGPLFGWALGSPWLGAGLGAAFEALTLEQLPLGGALDFSAPVAAGVAAWLAAGPAAVPCAAAFLAGLGAGWAHARVERTLRRGRGAAVSRAEAALAAGAPERLGAEIFGALAAQAAATFAVALLAFVAAGAAAARLWAATARAPPRGRADGVPRGAVARRGQPRGGALEARVTSSRVLSARLFLRSLLLQAGFSDARRQALGFAWALDPALESAYAGDGPGLRAARARHLDAFNVQPCAVGLPLGVAAALEARAAAGDPAAASRALALKSSLGAALSGAADALFWGGLRPLAAAASVVGTLAALRLGARHPFAWGAGSGLLIFDAPALWARGAGLGLGLSKGESAALAVSGIPAQAWIRGARRAAVLLIFAAVWAVLGGPFGLPRLFAAVAFACGASLGRFSGGPLRLVAAAAILGTLAAAAGVAGWLQ